MGNICRSPTAEGVFSHQLQNADLNYLITVDSAGTHAYHQGSPPDNRAQAAALKRGVDLSKQKARQVRDEDYAHYDYVLAMDSDNLAILLDRCPEEHRGKVQLFMSYANQSEHDEVPDPYYGGARGFEIVLDMIEDASAGLITHLRDRH